MGEKIKTIEMFSGVNGAFAQAGTLLSDPIELKNQDLDGVFSLHMISLGGTITVTVLVCSTETGTYIAPTTALAIFTAKAAGSYADEFEPPMFPWMKLLFTETNVAAVTSLKAWLNYK